MKTQRSLLHVITRADESVRSAPGKHAARHSARTPRALATRGIFILALVLGSLGAVAATWSGHGNVGHANAHQSTTHHTPATGAYMMSSVRFIPHPWMW
jgi:hypothetical protein